MVKIKDIANALEMFAPLPLQDDFDNAGLQIGLTDAEVTGVLLCLERLEDYRMMRHNEIASQCDSFINNSFSHIKTQ